MPSFRYHQISVTGTNEEAIQAAPGVITGWFITNTAVGFRYVKLFNTTTPPTLSVTTPHITLGIPPYGAANVAFDSMLEFDTGICIAMVTGIEIGSTAPVTEDDLSVDIFYV